MAAVTRIWIIDDIYGQHRRCDGDASDGPHAGPSKASRRLSALRPSLTLSRKRAMKSREEMPAQLIELPNGTSIPIANYDCRPEQAKYFANCFQGTWQRIPELVRFILNRHWTTGGKALSILLTTKSPPWAERRIGYASSSFDGDGLFCWSEVLPRIDDGPLTTTIAHELGHMAFIAIREPAHKARKNRQTEWLIAELLAQPSWGFDQALADEWLIRHMNTSATPAELNDCPLTDEQYAPEGMRHREMMQNQAEHRRKYREEVRVYFDIVAGICSQKTTATVREDPSSLDELLRTGNPQA
jgi:hypothetical protein